MPIKTQIEIDGLDVLEARLRALPKYIKGNQLRTAVRVGMADRVVQEAKRRAPVKSGRLRNAITKKIVGTGMRDAFTRVGDSFEGYNIGVNLGRSRKDPNGAWYWWFVENGTHGAVAGQNRRGGSGNPTDTKKKVLYDSATGVFFGRVAKGQAAQPYLRPAIEENRFKIANNWFPEQLDRVISAAERKAQRIQKG